MRTEVPIRKHAPDRGWEMFATPRRAVVGVLRPFQWQVSPFADRQVLADAADLLSPSNDGGDGIRGPLVLRCGVTVQFIAGCVNGVRLVRLQRSGRSHRCVKQQRPRSIYAAVTGTGGIQLATCSRCAGPSDYGSKGHLPGDFICRWGMNPQGFVHLSSSRHHRTIHGRDVGRSSCRSQE